MNVCHDLAVPSYTLEKGMPEAVLN